jgi:hypothetical protein
MLAVYNFNMLLAVRLGFGNSCFGTCISLAAGTAAKNFVCSQPMRELLKKAERGILYIEAMLSSSSEDESDY